MAAAIPAAIGLGSSVVGGIQGKGAQKAAKTQADNQLKLQQQMLSLVQPTLQSQANLASFSQDQIGQLLPQLLQQLSGSNSQFGDLASLFQGQGAEGLQKAYDTSGQLINSGNALMGQGNNLANSSLGFLLGAGNALKPAQRTYESLLSGQRAIDKFLPSAKTTFESIAPEIGNINQGAQSASSNIAKFAPRGGGRASSVAQIEMNRQKQINDQFFTQRKAQQGEGLQTALQAAQGQTGISNQMGNLFQQGFGAGLGQIGQGINTIGSGTQYLGTQGNLAQGQYSNLFNALGGQQNNQQQLGSLLSNLLGTAGSANQSMGSTVGNLYGTSLQGQQGQQQGQSSSGGIGTALTKLFSNPKVQGGIEGLWGNIFGGGNKNSSTNFGGAPDWME